MAASSSEQYSKSQSLPSRTAVHEIGHALMTYFNFRRFDKISIIADPSSLGRVDSKVIKIPNKKPSNLLLRFFFNYSLKKDWMIYYAGFAAEQVIFGDANEFTAYEDEIECRNIMNYLADSEKEYQMIKEMLTKKTYEFLHKKKELLIYFARSLDIAYELSYKEFLQEHKKYRKPKP